MPSQDVMQFAQILIVDDEPANVSLLELSLEKWGYTNLVSTTSPRDVVQLCLNHRPDIILLDLHMPDMDGFQVMEALQAALPGGLTIPILVITADYSPQVKRRALSAGAKDFLTKPFDQTELLLRMMNMLETRFLHIELANQNHRLEDMVAARTRELEASQREILERLARAAEYRDDDTGQHTHRVGSVAALIARAAGLPAASIDLVRRAAPLHDVGKIGVPDDILLKPGRLTPQEFEIIKPHTTIGAALLSGGSSDMVQMAECIALTHHERWDGGGYPAGLSGENIPLEGRIVSIADVFDALSHDRPYKKAWPQEEAVAEIERNAGTQFDPDLTATFVALWQDGTLTKPDSATARDEMPISYEDQMERAEAAQSGN